MSRRWRRKWVENIHYASTDNNRIKSISSIIRSNHRRAHKDSLSLPLFMFLASQIFRSGARFSVKKNRNSHTHEEGGKKREKHYQSWKNVISRRALSMSVCVRECVGSFHPCRPEACARRVHGQTYVCGPVCACECVWEKEKKKLPLSLFQEVFFFSLPISEVGNNRFFICHVVHWLIVFFPSLLSH